MLHAQQPCAVAEPGVDLKHPSVARVYDFILGGSANWAIDRKFAQHLLRNFPEMSEIALANRLFLNRMVRHLSRLGVRQFLDIGSGLLSSGNTHQIADEIDTNSRVVYVESESVAFAHGELLLDVDGDPDRHTIIDMDLRRADELWDEAQATGILDPTKPVAILMLSVLHVLRPELDGEDAGARLAARYRDLLPVGSYLGISHVTDDGIPQQIATKLAELRRLCRDRLNSKMWCRSRPAIEGLLTGFRLVPPGMAWTSAWHPEEADAPLPFADRPHYAAVWGGVGQKVE